MNKKILFLVTTLICASSALNAAATTENENISKPLSGLIYRCLPKNMYNFLSKNRIINILAKSSHIVGAHIGKLFEVPVTKKDIILNTVVWSCLAAFGTATTYHTLCDVYYEVPTLYNSRCLGDKIWLTIFCCMMAAAHISNVCCTDNITSCM